jgi:hypothetical protein
MALVDDFLRLDGVPAEASDAIHQPPVRSAPGPYVLATGQAADYRLPAPPPPRAARGRWSEVFEVPAEAGK